MIYPDKLYTVELLRRYKRFLADIKWPDGTIETVHCPNTGAMTGCAFEHSQARISLSANPKRKYRGTLQQTQNPDGVWIGVNPILANKLVHEAINKSLWKELDGWKFEAQEVTHAQSRFDLQLKKNKQLMWVEVKSVTLVENNVACFPDARSVRGVKHLLGLKDIVDQGGVAAMIYCVQREDVQVVQAAYKVDPDYAVAMQEAAKSGVIMLAGQCCVDEQSIEIVGSLPVIIKN